MIQRFQNVAFANLHLLAVGAFAFLIIYLSAFTKGYGYFIDEFYYIACANHPAFGYVDHPPLAPFILTIFQFLFGDSIPAIRFLPALASAFSAVLTGILTREMGGGKTAQVLAAASIACSPIVLAAGAFYSMNAFEPLLAIALILVVVRMMKEVRPRLWLLAGVFIGLGTMNKHTFVLFAAALVIALILGGQSRLIASKWFVLGGIVAFVIVLPNILWQVVNSYPSLEFYRNIREGKNVYTPPLAFFLGQVLAMSAANAPIWIAGTVFLFASRPFRQFRFMAILFILLFLFMLISGSSRPDRLMFAYPPVLAAGALFFEVMVRRFHLRWLPGLIGVLLIAGVAFALPIILPYFSYTQVEEYTRFVGFNTELEKGKKPPLPQLIADRIGWEEKFALVQNAYNGLTDEEKKEAIIAAGNYGQAGAIEYFGRSFGFPPVVSVHNTYYLWSKERLRGNILLQLDHSDALENLKRRFERVEPCEEEFTSPYVSSHENHLKVFVCKGPTIPYSEMLERGKMYH
jgi:hypothetical protein